MENRNLIKYLIAGFVVITAAYLFSAAYKYKFRSNETIAVTGLCEKEFMSDKVLWSADFSKHSMNLTEAYNGIKADEGKINNYLLKNGIKPVERVFSSVNINKDFENKFDAEGRQIGSEFRGYTLSQSVNVESKDMDKVEKISREITELIKEDIELSSHSPEYFYSKLADLKLELLGKAANDAQERAKTIAKNSGQALGDLKTSKMGVFQILGVNSGEDFSSGGAFNTSSRNKKASITIRSEFFIK